MPELSSDVRGRPGLFNHAGGAVHGRNQPPAVANNAVGDILNRYVDGLAGNRRAGIGFAPVAPGALRDAVEVQLGNGKDVFLSKSGNLVGRPGQDRAANAIELGEVMLRLATLEEGGAELFKNPKIVLAQKELAIQALVGAFQGALGEMPGNNGYQNKQQMLQARSASAPLLLDLALSLDDANPAEAAVKKKALDDYLRCLKAETHGLNRNFMIYDLDRVLDQLPREVRAVAGALMAEIDPTNPPYEEWFKNGNTTLRIDYSVGNGFWDEELADYVAHGFARKDNADGTVTLSKKLVNNGVETNVEMKMYNGPNGIFRKMNDPSTQIVIYSGHADYGRNVQRQLQNGTPQIGAKVFFGLQCGGKGVHNDLLARYPDLQVVQSRNSSYGGEDRRTLMNALDGFARRATWIDMSSENSRNNSDNYYYPSDTRFQKKAEDLDGDGKADLWDRVVSYNSFRPQAELQKQLSPIDPGQPAALLEGRPIHGALARFHRIAGYNEWAEELQDQRFINHGYYEGTKEDPIVRVKELDADEEGPRFRVDVNKLYAHATEETLGAALHFVLGRFCAEREGLNAGDAKGSGLLMAAKCLSIDNGSVEQEVWKALLACFGLPAGISYSDTLSIAKKDDNMSAGTSATLRALKESLQARGLAL
jgi:hypothetical protein